MMLPTMVPGVRALHRLQSQTFFLEIPPAELLPICRRSLASKLVLAATMCSSSTEVVERIEQFLGIANSGDLVSLNGETIVASGPAQMSALWINSGSNASLNPFDNLLLYDPSDAKMINAQQLAAQLHAPGDALLLPGGGGSGLGYIAPGQDKHILVAYDASLDFQQIHIPIVNIADVDLVNTTATNQSSTANCNVYASDMVSLIGVSLPSLTSANIDVV